MNTSCRVDVVPLVTGIVGFDAFKSTILEVGPGGSPVRLYDPASFKAPASWTWQPLLMVSNVPHVAADFAVGSPAPSTLTPQMFFPAFHLVSFISHHLPTSSACARTTRGDDTTHSPSEYTRIRLDDRLCFPGAPGGGAQIFMIDSGAGGADCIFHARHRARSSDR